MEPKLKLKGVKSKTGKNTHRAWDIVVVTAHYTAVIGISVRMIQAGPCGFFAHTAFL
jgi:hypothetical protein